MGLTCVWNVGAKTPRRLIPAETELIEALIAAPEKERYLQEDALDLVGRKAWAGLKHLQDRLPDVDFRHEAYKAALRNVQ